MRSLRSQIYIVQRTLGVVNAGFNNMEISVGGSETSMPHKALQIEHITAGFQYMRSKTMPQSVDSAGLSDSRLCFIHFEQVFYLAFMEITPIPSAWEQVMLRLAGLTIFQYRLSASNPL